MTFPTFMGKSILLSEISLVIYALALDYLQCANHVMDQNIQFFLTEEKPVEEQSARDETTEKLCVETDGAEVSLWKMLQYNRPEWTYIGLGILGSFMMGVSTPIYSVVFGYNQGILDGLDVDVLRDQSNFYALMYVSIGVFTAIGAFLQAFSFSIAGEGLTARLRALTFQSILSQEMAFFDQEENSVGSLCLRLSSDASNIQGAIGVRIGMLTQVKNHWIFNCRYHLIISYYFR